MPSLEELVSSEESRSPRPFPWLRVAIAGALIALLLLAIFLPPYFNLGKYRHTITASMSEALGRPVYVGGMQLRLLPTPGIVMTDFTVDEDPSFGYEPALHATSVVASLRLTSLWRGRLEVSRISLDEANLNIVRNAAGEWSIGSVLLRASQIANAPTGQRRLSARPRFPYIEATNARIDFKDGAEKKPFSLMNAEFSMWQANADEWRLRMRAQPRHKRAHRNRKQIRPKPFVENRRQRCRRIHRHQRNQSQRQTEHRQHPQQNRPHPRRQPHQRRAAIHPSRACGFPPIVLDRQHSGNACETPGDLSRIGHPDAIERGARIEYGGLCDECESHNNSYCGASRLRQAASQRGECQHWQIHGEEHPHTA